MDGYSYQSVCVVTGADGKPALAVPDVQSAAVVASHIGDGTGVAVVPVVQLPWFPVQQQAQQAGAEEVDTDGR